MKANAPDKIYIQPNAHDGWFESNPHSNIFVEYTRTDAFIETACEWIKENLLKHTYIYEGEVGIGMAVFLEEFKQAMKGEQNMKTGIELIAKERQRQIVVEGWTKEHDAEHKNSELAKAAICYADPNIYYHQENRMIRHRIPNKFWPEQWDARWFKPTDRIRDLVKAGALIAAEIDRLQAQKGEEV